MTQCTSRPNCPCDFCERLRIEHFCYRRDREMDAEMRARGARIPFRFEDVAEGFDLDLLCP